MGATMPIEIEIKSEREAGHQLHTDLTQRIAHRIQASNGRIAVLLRNHTLHAVYQPIVSLQTGAIYAHEALIRGVPDTELAFPDALLAQAAHEGLGFELECTGASIALQRWGQLRDPGRLFVNISDMNKLAQVADELHLTGISLALDDFGDGRSSLRLWSQIRPNIVKIDKYFTRDLHQPQRGRIAQAGILRGVDIAMAPALTPRSSNDDAAQLFHSKPELHAIAVVDVQRPVAIIGRAQFLNEYTKPYYRELWGKKSCMKNANDRPRLIERDHNVDELLGILTSEDQRYLTEGFIVVNNGRYVGLGTGDQLVRSVTEVRIEAARHANPLTFLPGNIPISQHSYLRWESINMRKKLDQLRHLVDKLGVRYGPQDDIVAHLKKELDVLEAEVELPRVERRKKRQLRYCFQTSAQQHFHASKPQRIT